ncbi:MAG: hypothetical protein FRX48_07585 [Lasallia pustulata]|uniref:Uncharacterized protein n=1 Tax=Lasallia pustulata TaxID=136370 RepID=A0A5M8PHI4_9LECA|nr:MAG: hypothetical protein FRX48_07585 [Lasallia pustulata]
MGAAAVEDAKPHLLVVLVPRIETGALSLRCINDYALISMNQQARGSKMLGGTQDATGIEYHAVVISRPFQENTAQ